MIHQLPLVSVGIASYNNAHYIKLTLDSIRDQDYPNCEIIIVDDCSKDNSVEVVKEWLLQNPATNTRLIIKEKNSGISATFNTFLAHAKGEYVSIVGSDDEYLPSRISLQVAAMQQLDADYGLCYSDVMRIDENGVPLDGGAACMRERGNPEGDVFPDLLNTNFIAVMTVLIRKSVIDEVGPFDETLCFEDWEMWLRIANKYKFKYVPGIFGKYRVHQGSFTSQRQKLIVEDSVKIIQKYMGINQRLDQIATKSLGQLAKQLYVLASPMATATLHNVFKHNKFSLFGLYYLMSASGIKYQSFQGAYKFLRSLTDKKIVKQ